MVAFHLHLAPDERPSGVCLQCSSPLKPVHCCKICSCVAGPTTPASVSYLTHMHATTLRLFPATRLPHTLSPMAEFRQGPTTCVLSWRSLQPL